MKMIRLRKLLIPIAHVEAGDAELEIHVHVRVEAPGLGEGGQRFDVPPQSQLAAAGERGRAWVFGGCTACARQQR